MSSKCIDFLYGIKSTIVNDCFVICVGLSLLSKTVDMTYVKLKGAKVFSPIDLRSGYHHIALGKSSRAKITFVTPFGRYKFLIV